mgnify:CR=1 FL=1
MKKFNDANVGLFILLTTCLSLFSCNNDNDNYPKDYVGFEKSTRTVECDKNQSESELQIKIIATDKSKEDRTVLLATPALPAGTDYETDRNQSHHQGGTEIGNDHH